MNRILAIILIAVVLGVATLSQPGSFFNRSNLGAQGAQYGSDVKKWLSDNAWSRVSGPLTEGEASLAQQMGGGVGKFIQPAQQEIVKQKDNFFQNMWGDVQNYLAGKFSQISGTNVTENVCLPR